MKTKQQNEKCQSCSKTIDKSGFDAESDGDGFCSNECAGRFNATKFRLSLSREYQKTIVSKLPCKRASAMILDWNPFLTDRRSLFIHGQSGTGKTRTVTHRLIKLIGDNEFDEPVIFMRGTAFRHETIERTRPGGIGGLDDWHAELCAADCLAIDEVDKIGFSDRVLEEFFDVLEERTSNRMPTILISNTQFDAWITRETERERVSNPETLLAIKRRIREFFAPVCFNA